MPSRSRPLPRGKGLERAGGLSRGEGPKRNASLRISTPSARARVDPPESRSPRASSKSPSKVAREAEERAAEKRTKAIVKARSEGLCEGCGQARATNVAHRWAKGQGGPWDPANALHLCGMGNASGCHGRSHSKPVECEPWGWIIPSHNGPRFAEIPVVHARFGRVLLGSDGSVVPAD